MKSHHAGMGVVVVEDVTSIDRSELDEWIAYLREYNGDTFTFIEEDGVQWAVNKTGFRFPMEDIIIAPQRYLDLWGMQCGVTPPQRFIDLAEQCEAAIYDALVEYCCYFPDAATTSWWRSNGHVAGYGPGQRIGLHCDNQVPYQWGARPQNQRSMHNSTSINLYLNDDYEGGELHFPNAGLVFKPKPGTVVAYPSNYVGRHEVMPVTSGERFAYLSVASWGVDFDSEEKIGDPNGVKRWMPDIVTDAQARRWAGDYRL